MSHTLTEVDSYDDSDELVVPDPGDDRKAVSVDGPFQQIANHARWCKTRIQEILAQFAGTLTVNQIAASGDIDCEADISAVSGIVSGGGLSAGTTGITSTGPATIIGRVGAIVYDTLLVTVPDTGGAVKSAAISGTADYNGSLFLVSPQTAGGGLKLLTTGAAQGDVMRTKLLISSANNFDIKDAGLITLTTLAPGDYAEFVFDGSIWQFFFKAPG